jgi:ferrochelatase
MVDPTPSTLPRASGPGDPRRLAVVLFNLGGPDSLDAVEPFLKNLFLDPAIIPAPGLIRKVLAGRIARKRAPITQEIYDKLGGKTPLLEMTHNQADELEKALKSGALTSEFEEIRVFVAMRYWHPRAEEVVAEVKAWGPAQVILLPLYPQYSTTTSQTSIDEWKREAVKQKLIAATRAQCCFAEDENFIAAHVTLLRGALEKVPGGVTPRVLFSAHGLPVSIIEKGDPYQDQIERTVAAVMKAPGFETLDHRVCYQSRVTPQEWIGPSTEDEIERAGREGVGIVLSPVAFVSEHSETLVELDLEYAELAREAGVACYIRVPALGTHRAFMASLQGLVEALAGRQDDCAFSGARGGQTCSGQFGACPRNSLQLVEI